MLFLLLKLCSQEVRCLISWREAMICLVEPNCIDLHGLSFREYLIFFDLILISIPVSEKSCEDTEQLVINWPDRILPHFNDYLKKGYYPFVFEDPHSYYEKFIELLTKAFLKI